MCATLDSLQKLEGAAHVLYVFIMSRTPVALDSVVWFSLAARSGAVDSSIRTSERSATGWVVEPVFSSYAAAREFARQAGAVIGYGVCCRQHPVVQLGSVTYHQPWSCSVPCAVPGHQLSLGQASRGSRAVIHA
jgi:hypothetical protein